MPSQAIAGKMPKTAATHDAVLEYAETFSA